MAKPKSKPISVNISDIHFNQNTIEIASQALQLALTHAQTLKIPLFISGDLNDTKANIRGEVANRLIQILSTANVPVYILEGNHDKLNEKGDPHGLNYLRPYATVLDTVERLSNIASNVFSLPYQNSTEKVKAALEAIPHGSIIFMHQGVLGAAMGDYVTDKTSIDPEALAPFKCISGHYHGHQTIGTLTYIGSPYTITFGEAHDEPKGFLVVNSDGSFERILTGLPKHVIIERDVEDLYEPIEGLSAQDKLWLKVKGPATELDKLRKRDIGEKLFGHANFKLDKYPTEDGEIQVSEVKLSDPETLDALIDCTNESTAQKVYLKSLWREVLNATRQV